MVSEKATWFYRQQLFLTKSNSNELSISFSQSDDSSVRTLYSQATTCQMNDVIRCLHFLLLLLPIDALVGSSLHYIGVSTLSIVAIVLH